MPPIVTLLTDYGLADSYVAEVKGVLLSLAPRVEIVDVTHEIAPGDVRAAQYVLSRAWPAFPEGTVHFAVVDPGVGTARRALAAEVAGHFFLAPDNGILSYLPADAHFVELSTPADLPFATFHGRDVFAPAAVALANGTGLSHLGARVTDVVVDLPRRPRVVGNETTGEVIYVDRFGTLVTNLAVPPEREARAARVRVANHEVGGIHQTFADVPVGGLVAFRGSGGTLEIAVRNGHAARQLGVGVGAAVLLTP